RTRCANFPMRPSLQIGSTTPASIMWNGNISVSVSRPCILQGPTNDLPKLRSKTVEFRPKRSLRVVPRRAVPLRFDESARKPVRPAEDPGDRLDIAPEVPEQPRARGSHRE